MRQTKKQIADQSLEFWQTRIPRVLSPEDTREITRNILGFFQTLMEWNSKANEDSEHATQLKATIAATDFEPLPKKSGRSL